MQHLRLLHCRCTLHLACLIYAVQLHLFAFEVHAHVQLQVANGLTVRTASKHTCAFALLLHCLSAAPMPQTFAAAAPFWS